jgi:hypothetical protein
VARAGALDVAVVLVFVAIGRTSHADGVTVPGLATTSWPFLAGLATGWAAARAWRRPDALVPTGVVVWLACVAVGMALRVAAGQGTAPAFVAVALCFLALGLLGWRLVVRRLRIRSGGGSALRAGGGPRQYRHVRPNP